MTTKQICSGVSLGKMCTTAPITFGGIGRKAKFSLLSHKADVRLFQRSLSRSVLLFGVLCARRGTPRTRAPHLLLKMSTGHFSVRLNRFIHRSIAASGPRSSEETSLSEVAWRLEALRSSSSPPKINRFSGTPEITKSG